MRIIFPTRRGQTYLRLDRACWWNRRGRVGERLCVEGGGDEGVIRGRGEGERCCEEEYGGEEAEGEGWWRGHDSSNLWGRMEEEKGIYRR